MGYRSDVVCAIYPEDRDAVNRNEENYPLLKTLMNTTFKSVLDTFKDNVHWYDDKQLLIFEMNDVKWYDSFPDVILFNKMLEFFRSEDNMRFCIEFARVGEEMEDVEVEYSDGAEYIIEVRREIHINH